MTCWSLLRRRGRCSDFIMIREKISTHSKTNLSFSHIYCNHICMLHSIIIMTSFRVITGYCSLLQSNNYCPIVEAMIDKYKDTYFWWLEENERKFSDPNRGTITVHLLLLWPTLIPLIIMIWKLTRKEYEIDLFIVQKYLEYVYFVHESYVPFVHTSNMHCHRWA